MGERVEQGPDACNKYPTSSYRRFSIKCESQAEFSGVDLFVPFSVETRPEEP
jgi:hypothetical protein